MMSSHYEYDIKQTNRKFKLQMPLGLNKSKMVNLKYDVLFK